MRGPLCGTRVYVVCLLKSEVPTSGARVCFVYEGAYFVAPVFVRYLREVHMFVERWPVVNCCQ